MITLSGNSRKLKACRISARYLFARAFFKNVRPGITIGVIAGREQVENTCQVHGGITTLSLLPVIFISVGGIFRMTAESVVCALFWYCFVGWCTAELHRRSGFYSRYSGAGYWISWSVMFLCWPVALPLYVDYIGGAGKRSNDDD